MRRLRSNLALVLWLVVFAAILILWAGSYWRHIHGHVLTNRSPEGYDYGGFQFFSWDSHFTVETFEVSGFLYSTGAPPRVGLELNLPNAPWRRDMLWANAETQGNVGLAGWYRKPGYGPVGTSHVIDIHYAPLAAIAAFFTWRSWRKRRRRHTRGFEVAAVETSPPGS